jgi:hypothetical protein
MSENQQKILQMLSEGKISVTEAQRLLSLVGTGANTENGDTVKTRLTPRYMHVVVEPKPGARRDETSHPDSCGREDRRDWHGKVNVRVPFALIRAGMKLATLIPVDAADKVDSAFKEKGFPFDFRKMKDEDIEALISALHDSEVNVETDYETVRVYAE